MKKAALYFAVVLSMGVVYGAPQSTTLKGSIMDSACASAGKHNPSMGSAKACTEACVKSGSKYVLYDDATKTVYQLDDQKKPAAFAGDKVEVTGMVDKATKTIHVADIKAAS